jgi:hypothetical protein
VSTYIVNQRANLEPVDGHHRTSNEVATLGQKGRCDPLNKIGFRLPQTEQDAARMGAFGVFPK